MDTPSYTPPVVPGPSANGPTSARTYLAKAFNVLLIVAPLTAVSAFLCFISALLYWKDRPEHFCKVTSYCGILLSLPPLLFFVCALGFIPALLTLDHLLALSPAFGNKVVTDEDINPRDVQDESPGDGNEGRHPSTSGRPIFTQVIFGVLALSASGAAILWMVAGVSAITSAALIIKYDSPFDESSDSKYKQRVIVGLTEAAVDLMLAALVTWFGVLCSRTRRSIAAATVPSGNTSTVSGVLNITLSDVWNGIRGPWNKRTGLDRPVLSLIGSLLLIMVSSMFYISYSPPEWFYFSGNYFLLSAVLMYPFFFTFNAARAASVIPGIFSRVSAIFILSLLSMLWIAFSTSFIVVAVYGLFCDHSSRRRHPYALPCDANGQRDAFVMAMLGSLLALAFGHSAVTAWRSKAGIQLRADPEDTGESPDI